jgi:hypothetical protein
MNVFWMSMARTGVRDKMKKTMRKRSMRKMGKSVKGKGRKGRMAKMRMDKIKIARSKGKRNTKDNSRNIHMKMKARNNMRRKNHQLNTMTKKEVSIGKISHRMFTTLLIPHCNR